MLDKSEFISYIIDIGDKKRDLHSPDTSLTLIHGGCQALETKENCTECGLPISEFKQIAQFNIGVCENCQLVALGAEEFPSKEPKIRCASHEH